MNKPLQQTFTLTGLLKSFGYASEGIVFVIKGQRNAKIHLFAAIIICCVGFLLHVSVNDWRWLVLCIALVWFAELVNTAFEYLCDVVMPDRHPLVKRAKDIVAGAVLICALGALIIGLLTLWPYLL